MKILVTGSKGVIGMVLKKNLDIPITDFDLPEHDARDFRQLTDVLYDHQAAIHLAWDTGSEKWNSENIQIDNSVMAINVYRAALKSSVKRVIMASSVHADNFLKPGKKLYKVDDVATPTGPYGAHKLFIEALGSYYAGRGLEVICIRFGGVGADNQPSKLPEHKRVWLSHRDLTSLVSMCLQAPSVPDNFSIIYGISDNPDKVHDTSNPFGWLPAKQ